MIAVSSRQSWLARIRHALAHWLGLNEVRLDSTIERGVVATHQLDGIVVRSEEDLYVAHLVCAGCGERTHYVTKPLSWVRRSTKIDLDAIETSVAYDLRDGGVTRLGAETVAAIIADLRRLREVERAALRLVEAQDPDSALRPDIAYRNLRVALGVK